eukprot:1155_1
MAVRVLLADKLGPQVEEQLKKDGCIVVTDPSLNGTKLRDKMQQFKPNIIVVRSTKINKSHLDASESLTLIVRAGAGFNTIAVDEASSKGIFVANCPGKNAYAVAELAMGHLINLDRNISDNVSLLRNGKWNKKQFSKGPRGLYGRTIAVIGAAGNIGKAVIARALSFGMNVNGMDPFLTEKDANKMGINYCKTLEDACNNADALTVHLPLLKSTKHIINRKVLSLLADGAYVINTSRGGVVKEKDIIDMIKEKQIKYACDVYENEPKSTDKIFKDKSVSDNINIYGTHHIGASTKQAAQAVGNETIRVIRTFLNTGEVVNCVNLERYTPAKFTVTIRHKDAVGVLANILNILKTDNINVQEMDNVVFRGAKSAFATLNVDQKPSSYAISAINNMKEVYGIEIKTKEIRAKL